MLLLAPRAGGAQRVADALAGCLRELGGEIVTGWLVKSLDELPRSQVVLLDLTPAQLLRLEGTRWPERYRRQLGRVPAARATSRALCSRLGA